MKKAYNAISLEVILLPTDDVIRTSDGVEVPTDRNELPFVPFSFVE